MYNILYNVVTNMLLLFVTTLYTHTEKMPRSGGAFFSIFIVVLCSFRIQVIFPVFCISRIHISIRDDAFVRFVKVIKVKHINALQKNVNSRFIGQADSLFPKSLRLLYHIKSKKSIGISEKI